MSSFICEGEDNIMDKLIPVHIGLMGHIDHGKTALARVLSERISTAGLDKHPQAQQRGITIDLGFTMFILDHLLVTLVDAPGHADLIRSVVAGANIIDSAILVVAADEGPKLQTGEHLVILRSLEIESLVIAITKTDLVNPKQVSTVESKMKQIVSDAGFQNIEFVQVSAHKGTGIDELRKSLLRVLTPRHRIRDGAVLMPIDHAFPIKGHGTVVTGTILKGRLETDELVEIAPLGRRGKIRSIQTFSQARREASAGDRVGINLPEIDHAQITRGDYLCTPGSISQSDNLFIHVNTNPLYKGRITKRMILNAAIGMPMVNAQIIPYVTSNSSKIVLDSVQSEEFDAALLLQRPIAIDAGAKVLLLRTDLPPSHMRIIGSALILDTASKIKLSRKKTRVGKIQRVRETDILVEGLASSKRVAESLTAVNVFSESGIRGTVRTTFGTRGVVSVVFEAPVSENEPVYYERLVEEEYSYGS
ncbi:selenocysteine-specific translation elongation factor [Candidatus Thorarchaeota archaeon]|nr:MAG: selenocysteine-specific translation elongation factor [Candidatus Thorarchaeota archaeon]